MNKCLRVPCPLLACVALSWPLAGAATDALDAGVTQQVQALALDASKAVSATLPGTRIEIEVGQLDPRLRLGPCEDVQPYLPPGTRLWGKARIGLRCASGPTRWNVFLPITVKVFGLSLVATTSLPAGSLVDTAHLGVAEVDLAAGTGAALTDRALAVGRTLSRPVAAGAALRSTDLKARQWFAAGDSVRIVAVGTGYAVSGEGQALSPGIEGQPVRVRTESGRIVSGQAVAERQVDVAL